MTDESPDAPEETPEETAANFDLIKSLPSDRNYTAMDKYRDFRRVFLGSEEGQRVLCEILSWGHLFSTPAFGRPVDSYAMAISTGEENIARRLLVTINREPKERPKRANTTKGET